MNASRWYRLKWRVRRWWQTRIAPWPIVGECYGHRPKAGKGIEPMLAAASCRQCNGDHEHEWLAWASAPGWVAGGPGIPVRCRVCGGRKCDAEGCDRRRHDHLHTDAS